MSASSPSASPRKATSGRSEATLNVPAPAGVMPADSSSLAKPLFPLENENHSSEYETCEFAAARATGLMECSIYQNYSASEVFVQGLAGMVNQQDVEAMIRAQKKMLQRFEKTNEMLSNCNTLSATRLERALRDFKVHTAFIMDMKKDVEHVLKRIRIVKQKLAAQHEEAFKAAGGITGPLKEEDDEYDEAIKLRKLQEQQHIQDTAKLVPPPQKQVLPQEPSQ